MTVKTNQLADLITQALGPIFAERPTYSVILDAMCIAMARVIQATPEGGHEITVLNYVTNTTRECLEKFLEIERNHVTPAMEAVEGFGAFADNSLENIIPLKPSSES